MQVDFRRTFEQDLRDLKDRKLKERIQRTIEAIESANSLEELSSIKAIQGHAGFYRLRVGDYRLGFFLDGNVVVLVRLLHRRDIYRYFP